MIGFWQAMKAGRRALRRAIGLAAIVMLAVWTLGCREKEPEPTMESMGREAGAAADRAAEEAGGALGEAMRGVGEATPPPVD